MRGVFRILLPRTSLPEVADDIHISIEEELTRFFYQFVFTSKETDYEILHEMALPGKLVSARLQDGNIRLTQTSIVRIIFKNSKPFVFTCSQKGDIVTTQFDKLRTLKKKNQSAFNFGSSQRT